MTSNIARNGFITALDVGTSKVACLLAKVDSRSSMHIISHSVCRSGGFKNGKVTNIATLEKWIRTALALAEDRAGCKIDSVIMNISSASIASSLIEAEARLAPIPVTETDIDKVLNNAFKAFERENIYIMHRIPFSYSIDGDEGKDDPRGMIGSTLGARITMISAAASPVRDLNTVAANSMVEVGKLVASPYASAIGVMSEDEKEMGCTVIDLGAGSISIAVMIGNKVMYVAAIPIGCHHITTDIAQCFSISATNAEKLKILEGSTFCSPYRAGEVLNNILDIKEENAIEITRQELTNVIAARMIELFELAAKKLEMDNFLNIASRRLVLTGGGSLLDGVKQTAQSVFTNKQIRIGNPVLKGLSDDMEKATFATTAGLLKYAFNTFDYPRKERKEFEKKAKRFGRIGQWFLQSF